MKPVETMTAAEMQHEWNKMFRTDWATPTEDSWCVPEMRELLIRARRGYFLIGSLSGRCRLGPDCAFSLATAKAG